MTDSLSMPPVTIIVAATSSALGIGLKGLLPWRLKHEIAYFKRATTFHPANLTNVVIMGRKCWESIPPRFRPLPGRHNIVLSRTGKAQGVEVAGSLEDAVRSVKTRDGFGRVFVIGGAEVYREAMKLHNCERILFTEVKGNVETDVSFPSDFRDGVNWTRKDHKDLETFVGGEVPRGDIVEGDLSYEFEMWERTP
jgi:dihydrofolate reductase